MIWIVAALLKKTDVYEILLVGTPRTRTLDNVPNMSVSKTDHADTVRRQSHARTHGGRGRWTMSQYVHVRHIWRGHRKCTTLGDGDGKVVVVKNLIMLLLSKDIGSLSNNVIHRAC